MHVNNLIDDIAKIVEGRCDETEERVVDALDSLREEVGLIWDAIGLIVDGNADQVAVPMQDGDKA